MNRETFITLLTKKISGEISQPEKLLLDEAMEHSKEYKSIYMNLINSKANKSLEIDTGEKLLKVWQQINSGPAPNVINKPTGYKNILRIAAIVFVVCGLGLFFYYKTRNNDVARWVSIESRNRKIDTTIADGSRILLNENAKIKFSEDFGKTGRTVFLTGNAIFDVAHNPRLPFNVVTGNIIVSVKGTLFKINNIDEKHSEVELLRGSVEVSNKLDRSNRILLKPAEKLIVNATDSTQLAFYVNAIGHSDFSANDTIEFKAERLENLVLRLEKKYNIVIEIQNDELKNKRFSGKFTNHTIKEVLEALKISYPFSYTISGNTIIIK